MAAALVHDEDVLVIVDALPTSVRISASAGGAAATALVNTTSTSIDFHISVQGALVPNFVKERLLTAVLTFVPARVQRVTATIPLGDIEMLEAIRQRSVRFASHAAGSTCLIDAHLAASLPGLPKHA
jgi:hypothetical protein